MTDSKGLPRRGWMLGILAMAGSAALTAGCSNTAEDSTLFPPVDTSKAAKTSDAPLAKDSDDADAIKPKGKRK